jgi:hypothetical protein
LVGASSEVVEENMSDGEDPQGGGGAVTSTAPSWDFSWKGMGLAALQLEDWTTYFLLAVCPPLFTQQISKSLKYNCVLPRSGNMASWHGDAVPMV